MFPSTQSVPVDTAFGSRDDALRRALVLAIPVGTQLGGIGLESIGRAASVGLDCGVRLATWTLSSAVRTASAGLAFANRNVWAPATSLAFGSPSSPSSVKFCTQGCVALPEEQGRKHTLSRTAVRLERAASKLRAGSAKCSMRKKQQAAAAAVAPILLAHFAAACALTPSSDLQDDPSPRGEDEAAVARWAVSTLGLQSSML